MAGLSLRPDQVYSLGFRASIVRSTLADAIAKRDWHMFAGLAQRLIIEARRLYAGEGLGFNQRNAVRAVDDATID